MKPVNCWTRPISWTRPIVMSDGTMRLAIHHSSRPMPTMAEGAPAAPRAGRTMRSGSPKSRTTQRAMTVTSSAACRRSLAQRQGCVSRSASRPAVAAEGLAVVAISRLGRGPAHGHGASRRLVLGAVTVRIGVLPAVAHVAIAVAVHRLVATADGLVGVVVYEGQRVRAPVGQRRPAGPPLLQPLGGEGADGAEDQAQGDYHELCPAATLVDGVGPVGLGQRLHLDAGLLGGP